MMDLPLGYQELLCSFGRISRTSVSYNSLSDLLLRGNPRTVQYRWNPWSGWGNMIFPPRKTEVVSGGLDRSRRFLLPRYNAFSGSWLSVGKFLPSPIQSVPSPPDLENLFISLH